MADDPAIRRIDLTRCRHAAVDTVADVPPTTPDASRNEFAAWGAWANRAERTTLYGRIATILAAADDTDELAAMLLCAPLPQRLPVLLFAAVQRVLFDHPDDPLAAFYPSLGAPPAAIGDAGLDAAFAAFCRRHRPAIEDLIATRQTQTNEVGRTALTMPVLARLAADVGPLAIAEVGASAGLNLSLDRFSYRYRWPGSEQVTSIGPASAVTIDCDWRGDDEPPGAVPPSAVAHGLDAAPIDVADTEAVRWLEACIWPDEPERRDRFVAAVALARAANVNVQAGDAVDDVAALVHDVGVDAHPVVITTWVLNYMSSERRAGFVAELDRIGDRRDLSWIAAESPLSCPELPAMPQRAEGDRDPTAVVLTRWRNGERTSEHLADAHPHGRWIAWR